MEVNDIISRNIGEEGDKIFIYCTCDNESNTINVELQSNDNDENE